MHADLHLLACKGAASQITLLGRNVRRNIEVEDVHRQSHSRTRVGNVYNTCDVALDRGAREQEIDLVVVVA